MHVSLAYDGPRGSQSSFTCSQSSFTFQQSSFNFPQSSFNFSHSPVLILGRHQCSLYCYALCCACCLEDGHFDIPFCDGCHYTANCARRNETFSFPCLRKSGFFGSGIVRLGYMTNIFIANGEPPIWATESYKESR